MYFSLKENNINKDALIIMRYYISKTEGRFVFSTGLNIANEDWDKENKIAKNYRGRSDLSAINRKLQKYATFLDKTLSYLDLNEVVVTRNVLKEKFNKEFKVSSEKNIDFKYFTDFVTDFILKAPKLTNRNTKKKYTSKMLKHYRKVNKRIIEFEKYRGAKILTSKFTITVYDEFLDYLSKEEYAENTIGNFVKHVKIFLKIAEKEYNYRVHTDYKENNFSVQKVESISIALSEKEIDFLYLKDFTKNERLQNCRDIAIIGLWTGLRVSDFLALSEIKVNQEFITVQPQKTKNSSGIKVVIPLHHHIKGIIENRGMPRMISDVKFNKYFKEVCKEIGLTQIVKGSLMVKDDIRGVYRKKIGMYAKYKLVSSHTCRRSFATNLYKMNFPTLSIMSITGHTTEKSFLTYIKVTPTEHAEKLLNHWKEYYNNKKTL